MRVVLASALCSANIFCLVGASLCKFAWVTSSGNWRHHSEVEGRGGGFSRYHHHHERIFNRIPTTWFVLGEFMRGRILSPYVRVDGQPSIALQGQSQEEDTSIPALAQAVDTEESKFGPMHPQVAKALIALGAALNVNGDLFPAKESCTRALQILQSVHGSNPNGEMAECLHILADIQQATSEEIGDTALNLQSMALELATRCWGLSDPKVAAYAHHLAKMSEHFSQFLLPDLPRPFYMPDPEPLYRHALSVTENVYGRDHIEVAKALDDLAMALLCWRKGTSDAEVGKAKLPEAEMLAERALLISEKTLGLENPDTAARAHRLGMVLIAEGKENMARTHIRRALEIREKILGPDHPDTATSRSLIGV
ncbi:unnamed protein product [Choristocarpus tenellus]